MFKIVVFLILANPYATGATDGLVIKNLDDSTLAFATKQECRQYIYGNWSKVLTYTYSQYEPGTMIGSVVCQEEV